MFAGLIFHEPYILVLDISTINNSYPRSIIHSIHCRFRNTWCAIPDINFLRKCNWLLMLGKTGHLCKNVKLEISAPAENLLFLQFELSKQHDFSFLKQQEKLPEIEKNILVI